MEIFFRPGCPSLHLGANLGSVRQIVRAASPPPIDLSGNRRNYPNTDDDEGGLPVTQDRDDERTREDHVGDEH